MDLSTKNGAADSQTNALFDLMERIDFTKGSNKVVKIVEERVSREIARLHTLTVNDDNRYAISQRLKSCEALALEIVKFRNALENTKGVVKACGGKAGKELDRAAMQILAYNIGFEQKNELPEAVKAWQEATGDLEDFCKHAQNLGEDTNLQKYVAEQYTRLNDYVPANMQNRTAGAKPEGTGLTLKNAAGVAAGAMLTLKAWNSLQESRAEDRTAEAHGQQPRPKSRLITFAKVFAVAVGVALTGGFLARMMGKNPTAPLTAARAKISSFAERVTTSRAQSATTAEIG